MHLRRIRAKHEEGLYRERLASRDKRGSNPIAIGSPVCSVHRIAEAEMGVARGFVVLPPLMFSIIIIQRYGDLALQFRGLAPCVVYSVLAGDVPLLLYALAIRLQYTCCFLLI